jgi:3-oxoadipate enol-lactonase
VPVVTLVLLPPVGLDEHCWDWLDLPVEAVRHVYPGFGRRPRNDQPADLDTWADEVAGLADGEPLDLVGVSMGSMVAQHVAVRHPDRVHSLLLGCTGGSADPAVALGRAEAAEAGTMTAVLDATLQRWFTAAALTARPEHPGVGYARGTLLALDPASWAAGWRAIAGHDVLARLGAVTAPTTCVAARHDLSAPVERVRRLARAIPGARLEILDGPHMIHLENPAAFSTVLVSHLRRHGLPRRGHRASAAAVWPGADSGAVPGSATASR